MSHGAGGKATQSMIEGLFVPAFGSETLAAMGDAGAVGEGARDDHRQLRGEADPLPRRLDRRAGRERHRERPRRVRAPGRWRLTLSLILEEGLPADDLRAEVEAIAAAARDAGVEIVAGDTKVVERGHADQMYICTTGVGKLDPRADMSPASLTPGDRVLVSGTVGDHGTAIMLARGEFELGAEIESDTCSLWPAVDALLEEAGPALSCMRDATRGGVASVLNELARSSKVAMIVREADVPVVPAVAGAAEILGIDPMYVANEGKLVAFVAPDAADGALAALRSVPGCEDAAEIGEVKTEPPGMVLVETGFGGKRVMDQLVGDPLPRIC